MFLKIFSASLNVLAGFLPGINTSLFEGNVKDTANIFANVSLPHVSVWQLKILH